MFICLFLEYGAVQRNPTFIGWSIFTTIIIKRTQTLFICNIMK